MRASYPRFRSAALFAAAITLAGCYPAAPHTQGASAVTQPAAKSGRTLELVGTEPFWGGTLDSDRFHYTTLENQTGWEVRGTSTASSAGSKFTGALDGKPFVVTITRTPCSDGMSDRSYAYRATVRWGEETRRGCADTPEALATMPRP